MSVSGPLTGWCTAGTSTTCCCRRCRLMAQPDVVERLSKLDIRAVGGSSADFGRTIAQEIELWTQVARANNIKAN